MMRWSCSGLRGLLRIALDRWIVGIVHIVVEAEASCLPSANDEGRSVPSGLYPPRRILRASIRPILRRIQGCRSNGQTMKLWLQSRFWSIELTIIPGRSLKSPQALRRAAVFCMFLQIISYHSPRSHFSISQSSTLARKSLQRAKVDPAGSGTCAERCRATA